MEPASSINRLKESKVFRDWKKEHKETYLVHAFALKEGAHFSGWQIGYYIKEHDRVVTFFIDNEIKLSPEEEIFKQDRHILRELDIDSVKIDAEQAIEEALEYQKLSYPNDKPNKTILILQKLDRGIVYNITFITAVFNTLNIKVGAESGEVIDHNFNSILDMTRRLK